MPINLSIPLFPVVYVTDVRERFTNNLCIVQYPVRYVGRDDSAEQVLHTN